MLENLLREDQVEEAVRKSAETPRVHDDADGIVAALLEHRKTFVEYILVDLHSKCIEAFVQQFPD